MSIEWNRRQIQQVVELYREKRELWDHADDNYHTKSKKNDAWLWIANGMGCKVDEVKKKMASLLSSYRRERMKMKKSMYSGKGRASTWFAFKYFTFLKEKYAPTRIMKTEIISDDEENLQDSSQNVFGEASSIDHTSHEEFATCAATNEEGRSRKRKVSQSAKQQNMKSKKKEEPRPMQAYSTLDSVGNIHYDECSTFGEHITTKLRKFDERRRTILMHKINNLIFEEEMCLYSQHHTSDPASFSLTVSPHCSPDPPQF
ncbi:uncharacterized protein LOC126470299 [Schistocerca serialis cubense]|uniref:uncharacterized protein LOC126470299 n=1 Tax=Schistocerca serialis cubense TaxID=2023355 RepID=UPI00214F5F82|nr:uncharacterized protein LOC126470299 [Schistocerca serialis cubense]